jgi:hypothetical protein
MRLIFPILLRKIKRMFPGVMLCGALMGTSEGLSGQTSFLDMSNQLGIPSDQTGGYLGAGMSVADFNDDGIDDLSLAHHGGELKFYLGNGEGFNEYLLNLSDYPFEAKSVVWVDIDNDGDQDLFITYRLHPNRMYLNHGGLVMEDISETCGILIADRRSYGASFGDYDNDGLLDLFVANYVSGSDEPFNELYHNLGNAQFEEVTFDLGMGQPLQQSFQGHWVDFNQDGLLDLHLIRDRLCFDNYYYEQQLDGTFENTAHDRDLDLMVNAMCSSTADFDRDNDQDLYVAAGMFEGNFLMVNDGGDFEAYEAVTGDSVEVHLTSWASTWFDADNDGWEDLHVCTGFSVYTNYPSILSQYPNVPDQLFWNDQGAFNEDDSGLFDANVLSFSSAASDYNLDGFPDLFSNAVGEYMQVLKAEPNSNRWLKVHLEGTVSNRDGVGARLRIYRDGLIGTRMTHCGENFLSQSSRWEHFGIGLSTALDSLVIEWPSGIVDRYYDLEPNQSMMALEGETLGVSPTCSGDTCPGCMYPLACNFDANATEDNGSCDFDCWTDAVACGAGTIWDEALQQCLVVPSDCPTDLNGDGVTSVLDLLVFLIAFNNQCEE